MIQDDKGLRIKAEYSPQVDGLRLYGISGNGHSQIFNAQPLLMKAVEDEELLRPMATISFSAAQELMDGLYRAGIRPSDGKDSVGAVEATEKHLNDMRTIVSAKLKVDL